MSGLLLLASACSHLQGAHSQGQQGQRDEGDRCAYASRSPPRSPTTILKLSDWRLLTSYASHLYNGIFACRLCPSHSSPFYADRGAMLMHLLQDHVFNAIDDDSTSDCCQSTATKLLGELAQQQHGEQRPRKARRLSAEAERINAQLLDCPFVNWRKMKDLIREPLEHLNHHQTCKLGVVLDHSFYTKPVCSGHQMQSDQGDASLSKGQRISTGTESSRLLPISMCCPVADDAAGVVLPFIASEVEIVAEEDKNAVSAARASALWECQRCGREFKKESNLLRHQSLYGCKVNAIQQRKQRHLRKQNMKHVKREFLATPRDLRAFESLLPSPDTEVASISQKLEAEEALLNAKCPSGYRLGSSSSGTYSPSTNSIFSSPERPSKQCEAVEESTVLLTLPKFASGPPPKEAKITTPKKASVSSESNPVQSPRISPNALSSNRSMSVASAFDVLPKKNSRSMSSSPPSVSSPESPRPPKRRTAQAGVQLKPRDSLAGCSDLIIRRPFLLDVGQVESEAVVRAALSCQPQAMPEACAEISGQQVCLHAVTETDGEVKSKSGPAKM